MSALKYWLWLRELRGLDSQIRLALLRHFESPEDVYYTDRDGLLLVDGVTPSAAKLLENKDLSGVDRILRDCDRLDLRIMTMHDADYPSRLENIYDPPCLLYVRGRLPIIDEEAALAVVGTRKCTPYGVSTAEKLGYGLAAGGAVVVTGLALGIDAAATRGALRAGGPTVCVLGNGIDVTYPPENRYLYQDVAATGALLTEYPPGTRPYGKNFPVRNRIMSGLAVATVVVEAPERSGALITAGTALEQGREVFAVPGPIDAPTSRGCNQLIRDGAGLISQASDVLEEYAARFPDKLHPERGNRQPQVMGYQTRRVEEAKAVPPTLDLSKNDLELTDDQRGILRALGREPMQVDDIIDRTELTARRVLAALTMLEVDELVTQHSGKRYSLAVTLRDN